METWFWTNMSNFFIKLLGVLFKHLLSPTLLSIPKTTFKYRMIVFPNVAILQSFISLRYVKQRDC